jgi:hypothetical protein
MAYMTLNVTKDTSPWEPVRIQASFVVTALNTGGKTTVRKITARHVAS